MSSKYLEVALARTVEQVEELNTKLAQFQHQLTTATKQLAELTAAAPETPTKPKAKKKAKAETKDNVTPIKKEEPEAEQPKTTDEELPSDIEELRGMVRNQMMVLIETEHKGNAAALIRRVAGDKKLPEISDYDTMVKLHGLYAEFIADNDLGATANG